MSRLSAEQIAALWPDPTAVAIALAESSGNPSARGDVDLTEPGEVSVGLWQINYRPSRDQGSSTRDPQANLDPATNAANARTIRRQQGWRAWSVYTSGAYRRHLDDARRAVATIEQAGPEYRTELTQIIPPLYPDPGTPGTPRGHAEGRTDELRESVAGQAATLIRWVADPTHWLRVGLGFGGALVVVVGVVLLSRDLLPTGAAVSTVARAAAATARS